MSFHHGPSARRQRNSSCASPELFDVLSRGKEEAWWLLGRGTSVDERAAIADVLL